MWQVLMHLEPHVALGDKVAPPALQFSTSCSLVLLLRLLLDLVLRLGVLGEVIGRFGQEATQAARQAQWRQPVVHLGLWEYTELG